jgi:PKD repeat protein
MRRRLAPGLCAAAVLAAAAPVSASAPEEHPFRTIDPAGLRAAKQRAAAGGSLGSPLQALAEPKAQGRDAWLVPAMNQPGIGAACPGALCGSPPDPTGAIGPSDYIEIVNSQVGLYSKANLSQTATRDLDLFVGAPGDNVFDPQIQFDPQSNKWIYVADDCTQPDCSTGNRLAYGFSKTADPSNLTTDWCNYSIDSDTSLANDLFDDYPKLGHNDTHIIIGVNTFNTTDFVSARVWTVGPKPNNVDLAACPTQGTLDADTHNYSGGGSASQPVEDQSYAALAANKLKTDDTVPQTAFTPVPADTMEGAANGYVVAADAPTTAPASQIMVWHVDGTGALVKDSSINVGSFNVPGNVPQPGTTDQLDSSDTRLTQAVAKTDPTVGVNALAVWTQHTIDGPGGRSQVRWYELTPSLATKKQQEGNVSNASHYVFNGAVSPSMSGNEAGIQYNVGSSTQLVQIRASSREATTPASTMVGEITLGTSTSRDQDFTCPSNDPTAPSCRWGDYAGLTPDPSSTNRVWGTNQLLGAPSADNPHWTTRNFALVVSGGPTASFTVTPNPAFTGDNVSFDATGSSVPAVPPAYAWELDGDGDFNDATGATTNKVYTAPGTPTVGVRVTDANGLSQDATTTLTIKDSAPTAAFTVSPGSVLRGQTVNLDASGSKDAEVASGGIATYEWDFDGNGTVDQVRNQPTTTTTYPSLGTFNVRLVVKDSDEGKASAPVTLPVAVQNAVPLAQMSFSPAAPVTGQPVTFSASATDQDGSVANYQWDLDGDGVFEANTGTTPSATRTYLTARSFTVFVKASDNDGGAGFGTTAVTVVAGPPVVIDLALKLKIAKVTSLRNLLRKGVGVVSTCTASCTLKLTLRIPGNNARKLKTKSVIGSATAKFTKAGVRNVRIKLTRSAKKALKHAPKRLAGTITGTAKGSSGKSVTRSGKTSIRR